MAKLVKCPPALAPLFAAGEAQLTAVLDDRSWDPETGTHQLEGDRYVLFRAEAIALNIREEIKKVLGESADAVMYKIGKGIGASTSGKVAIKYPDLPPEPLMALGPLAIALGGLANSTILEGSNISPDDSFVMFYEHSNSFEADSFKEKGIATSKNVCFLLAGFMAGWCSEAFGFPIDSREVSCTARGDDKCLFVMSATSKLREVTKDFCAKNGLSSPF